jgi:alkylation response protein AidB-like acyl-CoA dehydrogenase
MSADLTEFHDQLRAVARRLLENQRAQRDASAPPADVDWRLLVESGWVGLEVPESLGGAGATFAEQAVILHELGRAVTMSSYLGCAVLGVGALTLLEPSPGRDDLLRRVAGGELRVAVALETGDEAVAADPALFCLARAAGGLRLDGRAAFVPDAAGAELLVVALDSSSELIVVHVPAAVAGLSTTEQPVLDATRSLVEVLADGVEVSEASVLRFSADPRGSVQELVERAALGIACDSLGLAEAMLEATVAYTAARRQFERPIGSFQAVKHACADMHVKIQVGRGLIDAAVQALVGGGTETSAAVSMAKSYSCAAAVEVVGKALQLHGGIGYTWESGIHLYLKRAMLNRSLFGAPAAHRRALARRYDEGHLTSVETRS